MFWSSSFYLFLLQLLIGVKFLRRWPFVGRVRVCFVEPPYFQMTIKPIFTHGLDVTVLPGIAGWLVYVLSLLKQNQFWIISDYYYSTPSFCVLYLYDLLFCLFCLTGKASFHCLWADPCWGMIFQLWHSYVNSLSSNGCSVHRLYILPGFECKTWVASNFSEETSVCSFVIHTFHIVEVRWSFMWLSRMIKIQFIWFLREWADNGMNCFKS